MNGPTVPPANPQRDQPANFDRLARLYRWMEWFSFGPYLARCRLAFLGDMKRARHAVVFGDGDGRFTQALLQANPAVEVDAVDASAAMLRALTRRAGADANRVRTLAADARQWVPDPPPYDVVATHFFLDCLTTGEVQDLAARIRTALNPDAAWVVSEFAVPQGVYGRWVARPMIAFLYFAFRVMTGLRVRRLPDHHAALQQAGFKLRARRTWLAGLLAAEVWIPGETPRRFTP